jgi:hypothetical protein
MREAMCNDHKVGGVIVTESGIKTIFKVVGIALFVMVFLNYMPPEKVDAIPVVRLWGSATGNLEIWIEDVRDLYAASVDFKYDPNVLVLEEIQVGDLFEDSGLPWMEVVNQIDHRVGTAQFAVSLKGDVEPIKDTGILLIIHYKLLADEMPCFNLYDHRNKDISQEENFFIVKLVDYYLEYVSYRHRIQAQ